MSESSSSIIFKRYLIFLTLLILLVSTIIFRSILGLDYFPFKNFLVNEEYLSPNRHQLRPTGSLKLRHANVTILGMGMDIADNIPSVFDEMVVLGRLFETFQILFVEGNSKDNTIDKFIYVTNLYINCMRYLQMIAD